MAVNLEYYRTFYQVAVLGSMGKAAEALCLTTPTVTKTIQALEQQLGCTLFIRTARGTRLTAAGETLLAHVKPGLNILDAGEQEVNMLNSIEGGLVRLAMSEAAAHRLTMSAILEDFCGRYPRVRLVIKHLPVAAARAAVMSGDIDLAMLSLAPDEVPAGFDVRALYSSANITVVGRKYASLAACPLTLRQLQELPLVFTHEGYSIREYYEKLYRKRGFEFRPNIETPTLELQLLAVKMGLGYSFVPLLHAKSAVESGELFVLNVEDAPIFQRPVCLLTASGVPVSRAARELIDTLLSKSDEFES